MVQATVYILYTEKNPTTLYNDKFTALKSHYVMFNPLYPPQSVYISLTLRKKKAFNFFSFKLKKDRGL